MATKREIKKFIRNTCGALAAEILLARAAFPSIERKAVHEVLIDAAALQNASLTKVSVSFDKRPSDFATKAEYNKARHTYFAEAYNRLLDEFDAGVCAIVKKMNAALPEEVRSTFKEAVSE